MGLPRAPVEEMMLIDQPALRYSQASSSRNLLGGKALLEADERRSLGFFSHG
jgi:hypothetical protein